MKKERNSIKTIGLVGFALFLIEYGYHLVDSIIGFIDIIKYFDFPEPPYFLKIIEILFFVAIIYFAIDGIIKLSKNDDKSIFLKAIFVVFAITLCRLYEPIYQLLFNNQKLNLSIFFTTRNGICLLISLAFCLASFFLFKQKKYIRLALMLGAILPIVVLDVIDLTNIIPNFMYYFQLGSAYYATIFEPMVRIPALALLYLDFIFEK